MQKRKPENTFDAFRTERTFESNMYVKHVYCVKELHLKAASIPIRRHVVYIDPSSLSKCQYLPSIHIR